MVRHQNTVYLVAIAGDRTGWLRNFRRHRDVTVRIRGGSFRGVARELQDGESDRARDLYCSYTGPFEYLESLAHLPGRPRRERLAKMHNHWFDTGSPVAIDLHAS